MTCSRHCTRFIPSPTYSLEIFVKKHSFYQLLGMLAADGSWILPLLSAKKNIHISHKSMPQFLVNLYPMPNDWPMRDV